MTSLALAACWMARERRDPESEKGYFYRSDHFEFAKQGVPALYIDSGAEFLGKHRSTASTSDTYANLDYHKVSDEVKPDWDLSGAEEYLQLLYLIGWRVANGDIWPTWKEGTEFKATREKMLSK